MAPKDPTLPQSTDPELQADLVRLLRIQGPLGMLNVLDIVIPTVSMGQVVPLDVQVRQPSFRSTDIFSNGILGGQPFNTVFADTGQLADGTYDVKLGINPSDDVTTQVWHVEHRDAANAANLSVFQIMSAPESAPQIMTYGYEIALNERLRIITGINFAVGERAVATIFARRRA